MHIQIQFDCLRWRHFKVWTERWIGSSSQCPLLGLCPGGRQRYGEAAQHHLLSQKRSEACVNTRWSCALSAQARNTRFATVGFNNNVLLLATDAISFSWVCRFEHTPSTTPVLLGGIMAAQEPSPPSSLEGNKPGFSKKILANSHEIKHLCNSCQKILRRPLQAQCGHRFCSFCFNKAVRWVASWLWTS